MGEFSIYFVLGREHILDYANGYDHILFVVVLCALYTWSDWKRVLVLVTAFTIGHSITLALATLGVISVNSNLIEFLIPLTIFVTALSNIFKKENLASQPKIQINYLFALFFGLIHGMGFSNYLRALLGKSSSILSPLLAFNLGLEFGQIIVVTLFLTISYILVKWLKVSQRDWKMVISSAIAGIALILMKDRL
ncbi:MAG: HupE/UreJ family protein [Bacteroidetes bacterium]|nr:HupE/UreJ family protein [Bacteroidota bacterium]MBS1540070.1 HupE/UreJ family protein [Bacteroidota bacterium]